VSTTIVDIMLGKQERRLPCLAQIVPTGLDGSGTRAKACVRHRHCGSPWRDDQYDGKESATAL
jgi:hypothetical protein